jgi:hypothetical protein
MSTNTKDAPLSDEKSSECHIDIHIESQGDVNIYNCTSQVPNEQSCPPSPPEECETLPLPPDQCIPVIQGAKPKQSRKRKLEKLLANNRVPSALAASVFHLSRRFLQGRPAANPLEKSAFDVLRSLPPELKSILSCAVKSFDSLSSNERDRLFDTSLTNDLNTPIEPTTLAAAVSKELAQQVGVLAFDERTALEAERPGQNRFFDPGTPESFDVQFRICRVNGLRTFVFAPPLGLGDYEPAELQQHCEPVSNGEEVKINCEVQRNNCPGNFLSDGTCLRVLEVEAGDGVTLEGVNFISTDAKVLLTALAPGSANAEVEVHLFGDLDTPLNEVVNGETKLIRDCRVHDRLTFQVPNELPPGIYTIQLVMPNVSGIPVLGDRIFSNTEFINVIPPSSARFQIVAERLVARQETSPAWFGSDEAGVHVIAVPLLADGSLGGFQLLNGGKGREFGDLDSGNVRIMNDVLFSHQQSIVGVAMAVTGYEIDSRKAYNTQITTFTEAFIHILEKEWDFIKDHLKDGIGALKELGIKVALIVVGIAVVITLGIDLIYAAWAPADLIIEDQIGLTNVDLAALTSANFPSPGISKHRTANDIVVNVQPLEKNPQTYLELREYVSTEEESRYEILYRYNRIA